MICPYRPYSLLGVIVAIISCSEVQSAGPQPARISALIERLVQDGKVAGAQIAVGQSDSPLTVESFGVCDVRTNRPVNDDTRFCLGSCSKMFAAAVLLSLESDDVVELNTPIDKWLKSFQELQLASGGVASRAPTLRELLCHRAGVYSQRRGMTQSQARWIRDFRISLTQSVDGIASEPLSAEPGGRYSYSGAGYCVLGRVAEVAADKPFDELLADRVCRPLKLSRTSYFPPGNDSNVATGHQFRSGSLLPVPTSPHLRKEELKLPLIGGSLYAPAHEAAEFARMLLLRGKSQSGGNVLSEEAWTKMTRTHARKPGGGYGFGVMITHDQDGQVRTIEHGGALFGAFSFIAVDVQTKRFGVVTLTGAASREINRALQEWVSEPEQ